MGLDIMDKKLALAAVTLGSFIEMWAAAAYCDQFNDNVHDCRNDWAWAVACGVISLVICIVLIICMKCKPDIVEGIVGQICFVLLLILWMAGVAVCTFEKPFAPGPTGAHRPKISIPPRLSIRIAAVVFADLCD